MLIAKSKVRGILEVFLYPEDQKHMDQMTDLTLAATIMAEFGFQCDKRKRSETKAKLLETIQEFNTSKKTTGISLKEYGYTSSEDSPPDGLRLRDLIRVCDIFHKLVTKHKHVAKNHMLKWLSDAWDVGVHQHRVSSMEIEGGIMNQTDMVTNFGASLSLTGSSEGLLPD